MLVFGKSFGAVIESVEAGVVSWHLVHAGSFGLHVEVNEAGLSFMGWHFGVERGVVLSVPQVDSRVATMLLNRLFKLKGNNFFSICLHSDKALQRTTVLLGC